MSPKKGVLLLWNLFLCEIIKSLPSLKVSDDAGLQRREWRGRLGGWVEEIGQSSIFQGIEDLEIEKTWINTSRRDFQI